MLSDSWSVSVLDSNPIKEKGTDLLQCARTIEPLVAQQATFSRYGSSAGFSALAQAGERERFTSAFSPSRPGERTRPEPRRRTWGVGGRGTIWPSGRAGEGEGERGGGASSRRDRWWVGIYRKGRAGGVQRRKMGFHKWPIARDEGSAGDGGRRRRERTNAWLSVGKKGDGERERERESGESGESKRARERPQATQSLISSQTTLVAFIGREPLKITGTHRRWPLIHQSLSGTAHSSRT